MRFSAILLAAGMSRRMNGLNKLGLTIDGEPLIRRTAKTLLSSAMEEVVVVLGHEADKVRQFLDGLAVRFVMNDNYPEGQMTSVHTGVHALQDDTDGIFICLADIPFMKVADIEFLCQNFQEMTSRSVLVPTWQGQRGNPIVLSQIHLADILSGNRNFGCKNLIQKHPELVKTVEMPDDSLIIDIDTKESFDAVLLRAAKAKKRVLEMS